MNQRTSVIYDSLASYYREYSKQKSAYLSAVDKLVIKNIPENAKSMLDVGAGDGVRGMAIANKKNIKEVVLSDISLEMVKKCKRLRATEVWHTKAEDLPRKNARFDIILCLWNVLGHIENTRKRIQALKKMKFLLSGSGRIFIDVNNRYNAKAYNWPRVIKNIFLDLLLPNNKSGDIKYSWKINNKTIQAKGHLFTPLEIEDIFTKSRLKIEKKYTVSYGSGKLTASVFTGQLFYVLKK